MAQKTQNSKGGIKLILLKILLIVFCCFNYAHALEPIKIGVSLSLTGDFKAYSDDQKKGFQLWEKEINERGGILGREVRVIIKDNQSDTKKAQKDYEEFITKDKVDFLFGPYSSLIAEAVFPITEKYDFLIFSTGASADSIWEKGYRNVVGLLPVSSKRTLSFLELLLENGIDSIGIISADDPHSVAIAKGSKLNAERLGLKVVTFEIFQKGTRDLKKYAQKARDNEVKALIVCGHLIEAIDMRKAMKSINWYPTAYYGSGGVVSKKYYETLGNDANLSFGFSLFEKASGLPGAKEFYMKYKTLFGEEPTYHSAFAYSGGQILESAITKVGSINRKKVRDMIFSMDIMTISGRFSVDKTGRKLGHHLFLIQWQNNEKKIIKPDSLKNSKAIFKN